VRARQRLRVVQRAIFFNELHGLGYPDLREQGLRLGAQAATPERICPKQVPATPSRAFV